MRKGVVVCVLLFTLLYSCGRSGTSCGGIIQPPQVLDHPPVFPLTVREWPYTQITARCREIGAVGSELLACTRIGGGLQALTYLPLVDGINITRQDQDCLLHHEWGHTNGWAADHPGGRFL